MLENKYFGYALVLLNIANGDKDALTKARKIEEHLVTLTNALIDHMVEYGDFDTQEQVQLTFVVPSISG